MFASFDDIEPFDHHSLLSGFLTFRPEANVQNLRGEEGGLLSNELNVSILKDRYFSKD